MPNLTRRRPRPLPPEPLPDRLPPHSPEAEAGIIGCVLNSPDTAAQCFEQALAAGITQDSFFDLRCQCLFSNLLTLHRAGRSLDLLTLHDRLNSKQLLEQVGGLGFVSSLPDRVPSIANLPSYISTVVEKAALRKIIKTCTSVVSQAHTISWEDLQEFLWGAKSELTSAFESYEKQGSCGITYSWSELVKLDTTCDPNCVIGVHNDRTTRWLCRGQSAWLIGPSGVGKSALLIQFAAAFAAGLPMFGITPVRPLRVLVVQAENDGGDLGEMARGVDRGLDLGWSPEIEHNIRIRSIKGKIGQAFCIWLRREILNFNADLVMVDPLLSFAGIDVSRQDQVSQFCRVWLDPVLEETGAVLISNHHTGKPQKENGKHQPLTLLELAYAGIGSSELVNWARAVMILQAAGENTYRLCLAKRGKRAGATHPNGEPTLTVWLKHATDGAIYWRQIDPPEEAEEDKKPEKTYPKKVSDWDRRAAMNLHDFLFACSPDGESGRAIAERLSDWLQAHDEDVDLDCVRKSLLPKLVKNKKLMKRKELYFKGSNA